MKTLQTEEQDARVRKINDFLPIMRASPDRRKARRWINMVVRMTRYQVKACGITAGRTREEHVKQMMKFSRLCSMRHVWR